MVNNFVAHIDAGQPLHLEIPESFDAASQFSTAQQDVQQREGFNRDEVTISSVEGIAISGVLIGVTALAVFLNRNPAMRFRKQT